MGRVKSLTKNKKATTPDFKSCSAFKARFRKSLLLSGCFFTALFSGLSFASAQGAPVNSTSPKIVEFVPEKNPTNQLRVPLKIKFSETISGFGAEDIVLDNAKVDFVSGAGTNYIAYIIPDAEGEIKASIKPNSFADSDGNSNKNGAALTVLWDRTSPHFFEKHIIESDENDSNRIRIKLNLTEPVVGFDFSDIKLTKTSGSKDVKLEDFTGSKDHYEFYIRNTGEPEIVFSSC